MSRSSSASEHKEDFSSDQRSIRTVRSSQQSQSSRQKYYVVNASNYLTDGCQFNPNDLRNSVPLEITDKNFKKFKPHDQSDFSNIIDNNIDGLNERLNHLLYVTHGSCADGVWPYVRIPSVNVFYYLTALTKGTSLQFWTHIQLYEYFYKLLCKLTGETDIRFGDLPDEIKEKFEVWSWRPRSQSGRVLISTLYPEFTLRPAHPISLVPGEHRITLNNMRGERVITLSPRNPSVYRSMLNYYGLDTHRLYDVIKDILLPSIKRKRTEKRAKAIRDNTAKYTVDGGYRYVFRVIALRIGTSEITPGYQNITVDSYRKLTHLDIKPMIKTAVMSTVGSRLYGPRAAEFGRDGVFDNLVEDLEISRLYGTVDSNPYIRNRIYQNGKLKIKLEPNKPAPPLLPASYVLDLSVSGRPERFLLGGDVVNIGIRLNNVDESILGARPADQWSNSDGTLTL